MIKGQYWNFYHDGVVCSSCLGKVKDWDVDSFTDILICYKQLWFKKWLRMLLLGGSPRMDCFLFGQFVF